MSDDNELPRWMEHAACSGCDPDLWFPARGGDVAYPKRICNVCVVKSACLDYAMENDEKWGVWGGLSERQRRILRRQRREAAA